MIKKIKVKIINGFRKTSRYGVRLHPVTKKVSFHNGLDFVGSDLKLLAIADGEIIGSGFDEIAGNWIKVECKIGGDVYIFSYCHLKTRNYLEVVNGKTASYIPVSKGEWIATMGNSGRSTGVHCHLTVRRNGVVVDPEKSFEFI
jgi:murein DD-endopeptidase MepM/ murein hydrolase activator NlpD